MSTDSAVRPRRRTDGPARNSEKAFAEIPILLRLPDLYPSRAVDAAIARLSTPSHASPMPASALESPSESPNAQWQRVDSVAVSKPPAPPIVPSLPDWSSRIIVAGIIVTALVCAVMIQTRSHPDTDSPSAVRDTTAHHATAGRSDRPPGLNESGSSDAARVATRDPAHANHGPNNRANNGPNRGPHDGANEWNAGNDPGSSEQGPNSPISAPSRARAYPGMPAEFEEPVGKSTSGPDSRRVVTIPSTVPSSANPSESVQSREVAHDGPSRDGPSRDGPSRDGPSRDGPSRDGPSPDGTAQTAAAYPIHDAPIHPKWDGPDMPRTVRARHSE